MKSFIEFQKEEVELDEEQLDELSPKTLGSYIKKASDKKAIAMAGIVGNGTDDHRDKMATTFVKRGAGIKKAVDKLTKEETDLDEEQIDELSKSTLGSYTKKAAVSLAVSGIKMGRDIRPTAVIRDGEKTVTKRIKGINRATDKLTKEEVEIDEAHKIHDKVEIIKGSAKGTIGHIGEIRDGLYKGAPKTYTVYHGEHDATQVSKEHIRGIKEEAELDEEQIEERNKQNAMMRKTMDASRGAKFKARNDTTTPDAEPQHKTAQAHNKAIGRAIRQMSNEEVEQIDELSKDTLASYEKKSRVAAHKHALASELKGLAADPAGSYAHKQMADKRHAGWKVAVKKLNTEGFGDNAPDPKIVKDIQDTKKKQREDAKKREAEMDKNFKNYQSGNVRANWHTEEVEIEESENPFKNLPGKFTHILNKDVRSDHGIINMGTTLRRIGGDQYEVRAGKAKGKTVEIHKDHVIHKNFANVNEESDTPFEGPYKQSKGTVTDKSGAKHTPLSNVRSLARNAIEKMKQKMRMAHLSPEVKAEKLARNKTNEEVELDEEIIAKKLKEDVTTAAQKLKAALDRHTEHAVAANRAGDHEAVKVHQEYANKIKTKLGKLAKNEEVDMDEELEESIASHTRSQLMQKIKSGDWEAMSDIVPGQHVQIRHTGTNKRRMVHVKDSREDLPLGVKEESDQLPSRKPSYALGGPKSSAQSHQDHLDAIERTHQIYLKLKAKKEKEERGEGSEIKEAEMTDAEMAKREKIVKGMKKSFKDFTAKYGDRAKEVMYATATKKAMEEEVEEELEEDIDEGATTRNGAITVHKGTYGTSYQPNDDEDDEDTPEKKEPAVKRGRGRPAGADSGANTKGSKKAKTYGGVAVHSLRLPNNNK